MSKALTPLEEVKNALTNMGPQIKMILPEHIPVERFIRVAQTAITTNPTLMQTDRQSMFVACMKAAQDGLLPDGKESALVPFGGRVNYIPMVAGILKKIRNSGELASIGAHIVHERDEFNFWVDTDGEHLNHKPNFFADRGKPIGVYAVAKTKDGATYIEVLTHDDVTAVKKAGASKSGPWSGPFEFEMWKKSAIKRLSKRLPMSTDIDLFSHHEEADEVAERPSIEITPEPVVVVEKTKSQRLSQTVAASTVDVDTQPSNEVPL